ncbi:MAG: Holliday junction resolvase [Candidatus Aenigmarchaeota archaeon ex4484_224]|nr:MAG: Holliday junction resolvase [Candidatus Aenigmarchaeota archaeon ex4484_224]
MLEFLVILLTLVLIYLIYENLKLKIKFNSELEKWKMRYEEKIREDAIKRSSSVLVGKTIEKLIPFTKEFDFNPRDVRWIGDPIDFIVFNGISEKEPKEIIFVEVKSGKSKLSKIQSKIKELIEKKKIKWKEIKIKS